MMTSLVLRLRGFQKNVVRWFSKLFHLRMILRFETIKKGLPQLPDCYSYFHVYNAQKIKFSTKDFSSNCDQICRFLWICSHLLKKSLMKNFIFCPVLAGTKLFSTFTESSCSFLIFYHDFQEISRNGHLLELS